MSKTKPAPKPVENLPYEEALAELEEIVQALEEEQTTLEEAMALFSRGQALTARCAELLNAARLQVQKLTDGELIDFEETPG